MIDKLSNYILALTAPTGRDQYYRSQLLITALYILATFVSFTAVDSNLLGDSFLQSQGELSDYQPLWLIQWLGASDVMIALKILLPLRIVLGLCTVIYWRRSRSLRVAFLILFVVVEAIFGSFGKIDHHHHALMIGLMIACICPVLSPNLNPKSQDSWKLNLSIWTYQLLMLSLYSFSGITKLVSGALDWLADGSGLFGGQSMRYHAARAIYEHEGWVLLGSTVVAAPAWITSLLLLAGILIEAASLFIAFQPKLHRLWGCLLLLFHAGILMIMGPNFSVQALIMFCVLAFSPFAMRRPQVEA